MDPRGPPKWRRTLGYIGAVIAALSGLWLLLALVGLVPRPETEILNQSGIRLIAEITVAALLLAAFGFWET